MEEDEFEEVEEEVEDDEADANVAPAPKQEMDEKQHAKRRKLQPDGFRSGWMNKCVALMAAYERQDWTEAGRLIDVQLALEHCFMLCSNRVPKMVMSHKS